MNVAWPTEEEEERGNCFSALSHRDVSGPDCFSE